MKKIQRLDNYLNQAEEFLGRGLTSDNSKFQAWNHSLLRFLKNNYDDETYELFKKRYYSLNVWTCTTPESEFLKAFDDDISTTIEDLKCLISEELENHSDSEPISDKKSDNKIEIIINLFNRFHLVCRQLRHRYDSRESIDVCDEYDVQDLMHALLCIFFDDIRPEEWTPSYAGGCSRQDFLLKTEQIVIEIKKTRKGLQDKQIGEQLIIDIDRYKSHPDCKTLLCFVYDPEERIGNPKGLERDLTRVTDGLNVVTIIAQK